MKLNWMQACEKERVVPMDVSVRSLIIKIKSKHRKSGVVYLPGIMGYLGKGGVGTCDRKNRLYRDFYPC